jgi:hypothetical protein
MYIHIYGYQVAVLVVNVTAAAVGAIPVVVVGFTHILLTVTPMPSIRSFLMTPIHAAYLLLKLLDVVWMLPPAVSMSFHKKVRLVEHVRRSHTDHNVIRCHDGDSDDGSGNDGGDDDTHIIMSYAFKSILKYFYECVEAICI